MFAFCCLEAPAASSDDVIYADPIKAESQHFSPPSPTDTLVESVAAPPEDKPAARLDEDKPESVCPGPLAMDETPTPHDEHPSEHLQTIKDEARVVTDTLAIKAELARVSPKFFTLFADFQPGLIGAKFDGVVAVDITPAGQASKAGIKKGYKVLTFGGETVPEDATATKLSQWLLERLRSPRPVLVQFERPLLEAIFVDGILGLKFQGRTVVDVIPGLQAFDAGVKLGSNLLSIGAKLVPLEKTGTQLTEWLQQQLTAPRPVVMQFEHP